MTNPIIIDAIENSFIPLLVINNKGGVDAEVLKKYNEPAWNYQVIRFLTAEGKDIIAREDKVNSQRELSSRMVMALERSKQAVPDSLQLLAQSSDTNNLGRVAFSCACFWTGEYKIGAIEGVVSTESGWLGGHEVTLVIYHKKHITLGDLYKKAHALGVAHSVYVANQSQAAELKGMVKNTGLLSGYKKAKSSDQNRQLNGTDFSSLQLTESQLTKVNAFVRSDVKKAIRYLTHKQREQLSKNRKASEE